MFEWELPHLKYRTLEGDDTNFLGVKESPYKGYYCILIDKSQEDIVAKPEELKFAIQKGDLKPWKFRGMKAIWFSKHLYQPLLYLDNQTVEINPALLNKGERRFVEGLKVFHDGHPEFFENRDLDLLRNLGKGRGVGFFEAGNVHSDFIIFVDPKIQFYETIKEIEQRLGDSTVCLQSFIVSNTPSMTMRLMWNMEKSEMQRRNVLFQEEDRCSYVGTMLNG